MDLGMAKRFGESMRDGGTDPSPSSSKTGCGLE